MKATVLLMKDLYANDAMQAIMIIFLASAETHQNVSIVAEITCQDQVTVMSGKKEKEVMKIKVTQRLTYPEARKEYEKQTPEFTFSKIVQSIPKTESKTASTQYSEKDCEIT